MDTISQTLTQQIIDLKSMDKTRHLNLSSNGHTLTPYTFIFYGYTLRDVTSERDVYRYKANYGLDSFGIKMFDVM